MHLPRTSIALLGLALASPVVAQRAPAQPASPTINIPFERFTLPNGLTVVLSPNTATPTVAVDVWYHVGSKNEAQGKTGFAHMFEHVMFTGSGNIAYGLHDRLTEGVGGNNNGSTNEDRTNYYENVPSNYLETALWLESDRMGFLLDKLDSAKFVAQREIVQNERRQGIDNQPYGRAGEILTHGLYPETNPYSWPVVGYMTDLQAATVEDVKNFFRTYYAPGNATIAIVGDFDPTQAKALVTKYFGDLPKGRPFTRPAAKPPMLTTEKRMVFEDRVQVPRLYIAWPTVGVKETDSHALTVLTSILTGSRTARLTKGLVYDRQSAANVGAFQSSNEQLGDFTMIITPRPGNTLTQLEASADSIISRLKFEGPTAEEMARALAGIEFNFVAGLQSNLGKAEILNSGSVYFNDPGHYRTNYARLKGVTAADVKRVANTYLGAGRVVLSVVPEGKTDLAAKSQASRKVTVAPDGGHYIVESK
ncbi:MAG TPA: pitrilysin family protein [Gemmatimonadaceae bacterium]|nr:pitrilysin family protein [Gemmatimonadaceae bacterium]